MKFSRMRAFFVAILLCLNIGVFAQSFFSPGAWKHYRKEWQFSIGASNFLGDLGGKDQIGTNFLKDWEISQTRYSARLAFGYYLNQDFIWRSSINYGLVMGNDNTTQERFRNNRNLNFRSHVIEFNQNIQYLIFREKLGNKYGLKNIKGRKIGNRSMAIGIYLTAGIGVFYFNPQTKYNGATVNLHDYHTEGQGLPGGPKQYKRVSVSLPVGIGFRKALNRQWGLYMEFTQHYTFTDYLDDVSTVYYDKGELSASYGAISAALSDPNNGSLPAFVTATGNQRGDAKDKDNFMFFTLGTFYKVKTKGSVYGRTKRRKIKALF